MEFGHNSIAQIISPHPPLEKGGKGGFEMCLRFDLPAVRQGL